MIDLTPSERLIWEASNPPPLVIPPEIRLPPSVRDRMGSLPVILPSGNWPPGVTAVRQPDTAWRIDLVRDERPNSERAEFTRPAGSAPEFDTADINGSYRKIAARHAAQIGKLRFSRGVVYQANLGVVRFEFDGDDLIACHDLYSHPPNKHQAALINVYRVRLNLFEDERPRLKYDLPVES